MSQTDSPHAVSVLETATGIAEACEAVASQIERIQSRARQAKALIDQNTAESVKPLEKDLANLKRQLAGHMTRHRRTFRRYWGRTVTLPNGIIKWRIIPRSLQTPKDVKSAIQTLLEMPGGMEYLEAEYTLDRRALANAPRHVLRRLGFTNYRHEKLSLIPTDVDGTPRRGPIELSLRRFPAQPHIQD